MNRKNVLSLLFASVLGMFLLVSCDKEDPKAAPTITLSSNSIEAKAGESVNVTATYTAEAGVTSLTITKLLDGQVDGTPDVRTGLSESGTVNFSYLVAVEDADFILTFRFDLEDEEGRLVQTEVVVDVELTMHQLLLKYDWALSQEIRGLTGENDISDVYTDDIYRFNEDGTFDKSIGAMADDFSDAWYNYCKWDLNEDTGRLLMHRTGAFLGNVVDTLDITVLDKTALEANVTYLGLDIFNTGTEAVPYQAVEQYVKKFAAVAKGANFDPYGPGADDDNGPAGVCNDITLDN
jgi:hypothetical protein